MKTSSVLLSCPLCSHRFSNAIEVRNLGEPAFGHGLDFRLLPRDSNFAAEVATCPNCLFSAVTKDFERPVPGQVRALVSSKEYINIFEPRSKEETCARGWLAVISILKAKGLNPRDLGIISVKGSWAARELRCPDSEDELLESADAFLDDALRRGLTKGNPGMVIYLLGEANRRRGSFLRAKEMLTFLGNNPRYRYPALLLTVLIEEEDSTPYWSLHAPHEMEARSPQFKGLFPPLRSIPLGKTDFSRGELSEDSEHSDEDDGRRF